ncbi:MAG TPA: hypothetical protein PLX23_06960 [Candidatus Hydrogenedens sp.]|nr:hypothetical protein [Candidatus Hydrogenedens sp.]
MINKKKKHITKISRLNYASDCPFTVSSILKFVQDIIKIFIPVFQNKEPETPPPAGGTTTTTTTSSSSSTS